jgi:hypothetical protein
MIMTYLKPFRSLESALDNRLSWQTNFTLYLNFNIFNLATNDSFKLLRTCDKIPAGEAQAVATDGNTVNDVLMTAVVASTFCAYCSISLQSSKSASNSPKRLRTQSLRNFCKTTFNASLRTRTALLQLVTWVQLLRKQKNTGTTMAVITETLIYAHTTSRTHLTCDISLGSLTLRAPEAGDFVELALPYISPEPLRFPVRLFPVYFRPVA